MYMLAVTYQNIHINILYGMVWCLKKKKKLVKKRKDKNNKTIPRKTTRYRMEGT